MDTAAAASIAEQLAVVAAFILFLGGVWAFIRWVLVWAQKIMTEQRSEWQSFLDKENEKTRVWLNNQEAGNRRAMGQVTEALEAVNDNLRSLIDKHDAHSVHVNGKFEDIIVAVGGKAPARKRKPE